MNNTNTPPPKKSVLKKIITIVVSIIGLGILAGGTLCLFLIASFFHAIDGDCGVKSDTYKKESAKVAIFNAVSVIPGQPNEPASIYDSSSGTCNLDVAQSYSATKNYVVTMDGATALSTVTDNLKKQGFTLSRQVFSYGDSSSQHICFSSIWGWANYTGKSMVITVVFGSPNQECLGSDPPDTYSVRLLPSVTQAQFSNTTITSIRATVSTPDETF